MSLVKLVVMSAMYSYAASGEEFVIPEIETPPIQQKGVASWYGGGEGDKGLHGKFTATGEVFIPRRQTCASRSIPLNTVVLVEDPKTGNRTWCRVNDRGPYGALQDGRWVLKLSSEDPGEWRGVMDMSRGTATALGFDFRSGLNPIHIRYYSANRPKYFAVKWASDIPPL